jgi:hypothetical protein
MGKICHVALMVIVTGLPDTMFPVSTLEGWQVQVIKTQYTYNISGLAFYLGQRHRAKQSHLNESQC